MANLAAHYSIEQLNSRLLSPFTCTSQSDDSVSGRTFFNTRCEITSAVTGELQRLGGSTEKVTGRVILVKHGDGGLELLTVFLAAGRIVDRDGKSYSSLDEFVDGNNILAQDDVISAPLNITADPGEGEIVTIYGRTGVLWQPWVFGGVGLLVLVGVVLLVWRRLRSRRTAAPASP